MRTIAIVSLSLLTLLSCSQNPTSQSRSQKQIPNPNDRTCNGDPHQALTIHLNTNAKSADLLYKWFDSVANEATTRQPEAGVTPQQPTANPTAQQLATEPGTQIMAACARAALADDTLPPFAEELTRFNPNQEPDSDPYHIHRAWHQRHQTTKLLAALKAYDFADHVTRRVSAFLPDEPLDLTCDLYLVLTGWKWGDAMFTTIQKTGNTYSITDDGQPTVIINLSLMTELAGQDQSPDTIVQQVAENLVHECFHLGYAHYQAQTQAHSNARTQTPENSHPQTPANNLNQPHPKTPDNKTEQTPPTQQSPTQQPPTPNELTKLASLLQNEGIAHYISHNQAEKLITGYNQNEKYKAREQQAFQQLANAAAQLADPHATPDQKQQLLISGTSGNYWSKYACIAGLFMAYHIDHQAGRQTLRQTIKQGPQSFLTTYQKLQTQTPTLPKLPEELASYSRHAGHQPATATNRR